MVNGNAGGHIRHAAVAGQFYAGDPAALRAEIAHAFRSPLGPGEEPAVVQGPRRVFGIVAPHAGYRYSAQSAAWSFGELAADGRPEMVVLLGVNHRGLGAPIALSAATGWETPFGVMPVAVHLGEQLHALDEEATFDDRAHLLEHSLEVQVPFLQVLFGALPMLPIVLGQVSMGEVSRLGGALAVLAREHDLLFIASTDFSHYIPQHEAEMLDNLALQRIASIDPSGLVETVHQYGISMCGVFPVATMLTTAKELGIQSAKIMHYHTSGDVTGDLQEVVGYGAAALYR